MVVSGSFDIKGIVDGASVKSVTTYWLASSLSSGVTKTTEGWSTTSQVTTSVNKYLWQYVVTLYTDGQKIETDPAIIGVYGDKGEDAPPIRYNLFKNSDFLEVMSAWVEPPATQVIVKDIAAMGGRNGLKKAYSSNNNGYVDLAVLTEDELDVKLKPNKTYTLSFWAKGTCGRVLTIFYKYNSVYNEKNCVLDNTSEWHFFTQTFTFGNTVPAMIGFWRIYSGELTICMPKLEEGDTATEWCLAQSEMKSPEMEMVKWEELPSTYKCYAGVGSERKHTLAWYKGLWYACRKTHIKGEQTNPQSDVQSSLGYWTSSEYAKFIASDLALSRKILAQEIQTEGMVVEQLRTSGDGATISVQNGLLEVFGAVNQLSPNIRFGVNENGYAVMQYFDNEGKFLYDLGPSGISDINVREEKWIAYHRKYLGTSESSVMAGGAYKDVLYQDGTDVYKYVSKLVAGVPEDSANDGLFFTSKSKTSIKLNGWYCLTAASGATVEMPMQWGNGTIPTDISTYNPSISIGNGYIVNFKTLEYYTNGKLTRTQNVYWSIEL